MKIDVKVSKRSIATGKMNTKIVSLIVEDYIEWVDGKKVIQDAMPYLSPDDREFLLTGILPNEWDAMFGGEE